MTVVAEGLEWLIIYWVRGQLPKGSRLRNDISDPPCSGYQRAFVMRGEKRSTILCPYSLEAFTVTNSGIEIAMAKDPPEFRRDWIVDLMRRKWVEMQTRGWTKSYDVAAMVFRRLGEEVPAQIARDGEEDTKKRGGKETGTRLLKPVKRESKRGRFLAWFLEGECTRSVREAMAEFGMSRSNALSYLYMIQKDHGIGYELVGDMATVTLPDGCESPFDVDQWLE